MSRYTVKQLGVLSGVSIRTLHHYDDIGLLKPANVGVNGYRYYGREELLRLQQVLFFRELGFSLAEIRQTLAQPDFDQLQTLRRHRTRLEAAISRNRTLIDTLERTIRTLSGGNDMADKQIFAGFSPETQARYEEELKARFGSGVADSIEGSKARAARWTQADKARIQDEYEALEADFAEACVAGEPVGSPGVQALVARHHAWICHSWTPNRESYAGLGRLYVEHPDFAARFEARGAGLAAYLSQAMALFAERKL